MPIKERRRDVYKDVFAVPPKAPKHRDNNPYGIIRKGYEGKRDPIVKIKTAERPALAPYYPQVDPVLRPDIIKQYQGIGLNQEHSKLQAPSLKNKRYGKGYPAGGKDRDEDDIQDAPPPTARRKRTRAEAKATPAEDSEHAQPIVPDELINRYKNSVRPFHVLLDELGEMEADEKDHVFPMPKLKCQDYLWSCQGKRRTGKTTTWKGVFPRYAHGYPYVYFFAQTRFASQFADYAPPQAIHKGFSEGVLWKLLSIQEEKIKYNLRQYEYWSQYEDPNMLANIPNPYIYMLWDDTIGGRLVHDSEVLNDIAYFGRHYRTAGWINTQHGHAIHPGFRANTDIAIGFQQAQWNQRETYRREYLSFLENKRTFDNLYDEFTADRQFIAIDLASIEKKWEERMFIGCPDRDVRPLKVGCQEYWTEFS